MVIESSPTLFLLVVYTLRYRLLVRPDTNVRRFITYIYTAVRFGGAMLRNSHR